MSCKFFLITLYFIAKESTASRRKMDCQSLYESKIQQNNLLEGTFIKLGWPVLGFNKHEGEDVEMTCNYVGFRGGDPKYSPMVELKWMKDGIPIIEEDERISIFGCNKKPFVNGTNLSIQNLTASDSGEYQCKLWYEGGFPEQPFIFEESFDLDVDGIGTKTVLQTTTMTTVNPFVKPEYDIEYNQKEILITVVLSVFILIAVLAAMISCTHKNGILAFKVFLQKCSPGDGDIELKQKLKATGPMSKKQVELITRKFRHLFPFLTEENLNDLIHVEIRRERLQCNLEYSLPIVLGTGNFGQVFKGKILDSKNKIVPIALKRLNDKCTLDDMENFLKEALHLIKAGCHENIVSLKGTVMLDAFLNYDLESTVICRPPIITMELATGGNLRNYLINKRQWDNGEGKKDCQQIKCNDLVSFALQIARGMNHLAQKKIVHRDLAARNILITKGMVLKISDFGMSKFLAADKEYYQLNQNAITPIKWTAPEAIWTRKFTLETDVWSYGVLLWEIMSLGEVPYRNFPPTQLYKYLEEGKRLQQPQLCPVDIYVTMYECWRWNASERPSFSYLVKVFEELMKSTSTGEYLTTAIPARARINGISSKVTSSINSSEISDESYLPMLSTNSSASGSSNTSSISSSMTSDETTIDMHLIEVMNPGYVQ